MLAVIEPMVRFILLANCASFSNITAASGYFASRNLGPFARRSWPETGAPYRFGNALDGLVRHLLAHAVIHDDGHPLPILARLSDLPGIARLKDREGVPRTQHGTDLACHAALHSISNATLLITAAVLGV